MSQARADAKTNTHQVRGPMTMTRTQPWLNLLVLMLVVLCLNNCGNKRVDVNQQVRDQAAKNASLIQVTPMVPAAVLSLLDEADEQLRLGQVNQAIMTIQRAASISPNSALIQQHLAEAYLADGQYKQALYWSTLVVNQGPDKGAMCERSRRTQALAAELMNQTQVQAQALESIEACSTLAPDRF